MRHLAPLTIAFACAALLHATLLPVGASYVGRAAVLPGRPELAIRLGETPESLDAGQTLSVELSLINSGTADSPPLDTALFLSRGREIDDDATRIPLEWNAPVTVAAGQTRNTRVGWQVPSDLDGPYFLIARAQGLPDPAASEEQAAPPLAAARWIWIQGQQPARLAVDAIDAPRRALAGGTLSVGHTLHNQGPGWAAGGWTDTVWLSVDGRVSEDDLLLRSVPRRRPLAPGQSDVAAPGEAVLPLNLTPGPYRLIVRPGTDDHQTLDVPLNVRPPSHPDLVVRRVKAPKQIVIGRPAPLTFDVVNRSPVDAASQEPWIDAVYLSDDDALSDDDVLLAAGGDVAQIPGNGRVRRGPVGVTVEARDAVSTQMHLLVVANDDGALDEGEFDYNNAASVEIQLLDPADLEAPELTELGRDDEPPRVTVAWIPLDAFEELQARVSVTQQPAVQDQADPVPGAPLERDPEDAAAAQAAPPSPPSPVTADGSTPPAAQTAALSRHPADPSVPGELPAGRRADVDRPGDAAADAPGLPVPVVAATPPPPPSPPVTQNPGDKPTSAPRDDREADPTSVVDAGTVRPGAVLVGPGMEIKTFRPRYSVVARSAVPRNPTAMITFDTDGTVIHAELLPSTGYENVDAPVLTSLYRWKARGKRVDAATAPFGIKIKILLVDDGLDSEAQEN